MQIFAYLLLILLVSFSPDPLNMFYAGIVLLWITQMMWRKNEPKILLVSLVVYWLNTSLLLPYGALFAEPLQNLSQYAPKTIVFTNFLAVTALVFYAWGIRWQLGSVKKISFAQVEAELQRYDGKKLLLAYILYSFFASFISRIFLSLTGGQLLSGLIQLKWTFLTFVIIHTLVIPQNRKYVYLFLAFEILLSFSGYWASFKDYILVAAAAFTTLTNRIGARTLLLFLFLGIFTFIIAVVWTNVKPAYRMFLTGGKRSQLVVQTDAQTNLNKLLEIVGNNFSATNYRENFKSGAIGLINRVSYIEYFAMAVGRVPEIMRYEDGQLLEDAFAHIFQPRFLFPNKKVIDDSEITTKYTGRKFSGLQEGSSFSLGSVPERYVDFGPFLMFVPIFFFGVWIGFLYKTMVNKGFNIVWGICFVAPFFTFVVSFGVATTKFFGWSIYYFLTFWAVNTFVLPYFNSFLLKSNTGS